MAVTRTYSYSRKPDDLFGEAINNAHWPPEGFEITIVECVPALRHWWQWWKPAGWELRVTYNPSRRYVMDWAMNVYRE